ncbi:MAG: LytTR family DNA-binding domain-containing protein [Rikenellaceae bacterium]
MKTVIIEDEKAAVRNLTSLLLEIRHDTQIAAVIDSIADAIEWFSTNPMPNFVFMDIHLADGSAFEIFEHVSITCPIIFTTAYDEYALRAFKVNSIDYLLKPIGKEEMQRAFDKLDHLHGIDSAEVDDHKEQSNTLQTSELLNIFRSLKKQEKYKTHFLIPLKGDKLLPVSVEMIRLFYIKDGQVKAILNDNREYVFPQTLDELTECLNPMLFFRINRQYLISRESIKDIDLWFNSRLSINLYYPIDNEKILVSKTRVAEFKEWFSRKSANFEQ